MDNTIDKLSSNKFSESNLRVRLETDLSIYARELTSRDAPSLKSIRLRALLEEGDLFGPSIVTEAKLSDKEWEIKSTKTNEQCYFGLFDADKLIGIVAASKWDRDPTGRTALWGSAYVSPEYRGQGLAALMYKARESWTQNHPNYRSAVFFIRDGNQRSIDIHKKQGAFFIGSEMLEWENRPTVLWHWFRMRLKPYQKTPISSMYSSQRPQPDRTAPCIAA